MGDSATYCKLSTTRRCLVTDDDDDDDDDHDHDHDHDDAGALFEHFGGKSILGGVQIGVTIAGEVLVF